MPELVDIIAATYCPSGDIGRQRWFAAGAALRSWSKHLTGAIVELTIVDDGSPEPFTSTKIQRARFRSNLRDAAVSLLTSERLGCGGAFNVGVRSVLTDPDATVVALMQDDWELSFKLDLAPSLALLDSGVADIVRLGPTHPQLRAHVVRTDIPDAEWCLEYDWAGGGYVVGWRPALYHRRVFERFPLSGLEGLSAIEAERVWVENMAQSDNPPRVFHAPNCTLAGPFRHIETVELGEDDPATLTARYAG